MSKLEYNSAYETQTEARITTTNRKPNVVAIALAFAAEIQLFENACFQVLEETGLDGEGAQLDALGKVLVEPRKGRDDAPYLAFLRAKIRALRSFGRTEDVIDTVRLVLGEEGLVYRDYTDGNYEFEKIDADPDALQSADDAADMADPLCSRGQIIYTLGPESNYVIWGSVYATVDRANGFDTISGGFPGLWGGVIA